VVGEKKGGGPADTTSGAGDKSGFAGQFWFCRRHNFLIMEFSPKILME